MDRPVCCSQTALILVHEVLKTYRDVILIYECLHCKQHWKYEFHESMLWPDNEDIRETWERVES